MFDYVFAAENEANMRGNPLFNLIPLGLLLLIFYFLLMRPQQKKIREHNKMLSLLKKGDKVMTAGGIIGTVEKTDPDNTFVTMKIAEGVVIVIEKSFISQLVTPSNATTPKTE